VVSQTGTGSTAATSVKAAGADEISSLGDSHLPTDGNANHGPIKTAGAEVAVAEVAVSEHAWEDVVRILAVATGAEVGEVEVPEVAVAVEVGEEAVRVLIVAAGAGQEEVGAQEAVGDIKTAEAVGRVLAVAVGDEDGVDEDDDAVAIRAGDGVNGSSSRFHLNWLAAGSSRRSRRLIVGGFAPSPLRSRRRSSMASSLENSRLVVDRNHRGRTTGAAGSIS